MRNDVGRYSIKGKICPGARIHIEIEYEDVEEYEEDPEDPDEEEELEGADPDLDDMIPPYINAEKVVVGFERAAIKNTN